MKRFLFAAASFVSLFLAAACSQTQALPTALHMATAQASASETPTATSLPTPSELPASPTPDGPIVFAVIGDYGLAGEFEEQVADLVKSWEPDFIVTVGDNNYPTGARQTIDANIGQYYHEYIHPYLGEFGEGADRNRFFPALGNHDWKTGALAYLDYFTLPGNERYYDVHWEPVHLFIVDSDTREEDGIGRSSVQAAWLQEQMLASNAPWKLVFMHHPPYSSAFHGSTIAVQWDYADWGADAVIAGHDHVYERLEIDGLLYLVNGLSGSPNRYEFLNILEGSQLRYRERHGAIRVSADPDQILFEFITIEGEVIDSLTLYAAD